MQVHPTSEVSYLSLKKVGRFWRYLLQNFPETIDFLASVEQQQRDHFNGFVEALYESFFDSSDEFRVQLFGIIKVRGSLPRRMSPCTTSSAAVAFGVRGWCGDGAFAVRRCPCVWLIGPTCLATARYTSFIRVHMQVPHYHVTALCLAGLICKVHVALMLAEMRVTVTIMQDKYKAPVAQWLSSCEDEDREFLQVSDSLRGPACCMLQRSS